MLAGYRDVVRTSRVCAIHDAQAAGSALVKETVFLLPLLAFAATDEALEQFCSDNVAVT
jgi:hypothetical protein